MTGLEKILKAIEEAAQANANETISKALKEAEEITAATKKESEKKCADIVLKFETEKKAVLSRAESSAALQEKKILLEAKQHIINEVITKARNSLSGLSDMEYTDVILQMVEKYAHNKPGKIVFPSKDKKRLSQDFETRLKQVLSDKNEALLEITEDSSSLDEGFLLVYGDIEENCSFDALFEAAKEDLQDKVNAYLFQADDHSAHMLHE